MTMCIDGGELSTCELERCGSAESDESETDSCATLLEAREVRLWAGCSEGTRCDLCQRDIAPAEVEYEVDAEVSDRTVHLHFHLSCYRCWKARRR